MAVLGVQNVKGMQGNDKKYYKTHACAKHYAVTAVPSRSATASTHPSSSATCGRPTSPLSRLS